MTAAFIIQNQHHFFLSKNGEWLDGREANALYKTIHKDEAINMKVEHSVRDPNLRLRIVDCSLNDKGLPIINSNEITLPDPIQPSMDAQATEAIDQGEKDLFTEDSEEAKQETESLSV